MLFIFNLLNINFPYAPDSSINYPFGIKLEAEVSNPSDTSYKFCVWVYDKLFGSYISKIWVPNLGWKWAYQGYQKFLQDTGSIRTNWSYIKIYKPCSDSYYIAFKVKNSDTDEIKVYSPEFLITDDIGFLCGTVYKDSGLTIPYENINIIALSENGEWLGAYASENNEIDEGNEIISGKFCIPVKSGIVSSLKFEDKLGNPVKAFIQKEPPFTIKKGETTYVDLFNILNVEFSNKNPMPGEIVKIIINICNYSENIPNVHVYVYCNNDKIGEKLLDTLFGYSCTFAEIDWQTSFQGKYEIKVIVKSNSYTSTYVTYLTVGMGDLIINEIMYNPNNSGEWIEIFNKSDKKINIKNYKINNVEITNEDCYILPNEYVIVAESSITFLSSIYGEINSQFFSLGSKFPTFRNTIDTIILSDADGAISDFLIYKNEWGGGKGISLERISPLIFTNDENNWGSCILLIGGTPGKVNSIYAEYIPKEVKMEVKPEIFNPNKNEVTFISYTLPFSKCNVRVYIYDRCGRLVKKLLDGNPSGSQSRYILEKDKITWAQIWNGRDENNNILPIGIYIVYLEAKEENSVNAISSKSKVVIAK